MEWFPLKQNIGSPLALLISVRPNWKVKVRVTDYGIFENNFEDLKWTWNFKFCNLIWNNLNSWHFQERDFIHNSKHYHWVSSDIVLLQIATWSLLSVCDDHAFRKTFFLMQTLKLLPFTALICLDRKKKLQFCDAQMMTNNWNAWANCNQRLTNFQERQFSSRWGTK